MSEIKNIPIVEVKSFNYLDILPCLTIALKSSIFISIDSELSGLGNRKLLMHKDIDERYKSISDVAKTRSIISLGISCFRLNEKSSEEKTVNFTVQTFDLLLLCVDDYVVESSTLTFLLDHGFDFNAQYKYGLPYYRGNDKADASLKIATVRDLFSEIVKAKKPFVVHNGLVDLIFIYENLYSALPIKLPTFLSDLSLMFCSAIYDTKYLADFEMRSEASYLEYIFRKCQRQNCIRSSQQKYFCKISFLNYDNSQPVVMLPCSLTSQPCLRDVGKASVCQNFANHGWCANGSNCTDSHDVDLILDAEEREKQNCTNKTDDAKKTMDDDENLPDGASTKSQSQSNGAIDRADKNAMDLDGSSISKLNGESNVASKNNGGSNNSDDSRGANRLDASSLNACVDLPPISPEDKTATDPTQTNRTNGHRAGLDAFMTGYIFATFLVRKKAIKGGLISAEFCEEFGNKVYLGGKDFPLQVVQSSYAKQSKNHTEKYKRLFTD